MSHGRTSGRWESWDAFQWGVVCAQSSYRLEVRQPLGEVSFDYEASHTSWADSRTLWGESQRVPSVFVLGDSRVMRLKCVPITEPSNWDPQVGVMWSTNWECPLGDKPHLPLGATAWSQAHWSQKEKMSPSVCLYIVHKYSHPADFGFLLMLQPQVSICCWDFVSLDLKACGVTCFLHVTNKYKKCIMHLYSTPESVFYGISFLPWKKEKSHIFNFQSHNYEK